MIDTPHRRFNPLTRDWVLVSPHRGRRPWLGQVEKVPSEILPPYDPACYLCPGNERAGGVRNPPYTGTFVFDNDFAALLPEEQPATSAPSHPLLASSPERGLCRVVCFSPRHDLTLPELETSAIENVLAAWTRAKRRSGRKGFYPLCTGLREQGRPDGLLEPASAQPDLGAVPTAQ